MKRETPNFSNLAEKLQAALAPKIQSEPSNPEHSGKLPPCPCNSLGSSAKLNGRRSSIYTPEVISKVLSLIESGYKERDACFQAGISPNGWRLMKQRRPDVWERVIAAKAVARKRKLEQAQQELAELRSMRRASKAARRPISRVLPRDIQLIRWRLVSRVSLDQPELTRAIVEEACTHYGTDYARWLVYDEKHRLIDWCYKKRAMMRGEQLLGKPEPEKLTPNFKIDSRYGKVRADSGARIASR
jgi:hypothetical protein